MALNLFKAEEGGLHQVVALWTEKGNVAHALSVITDVTGLVITGYRDVKVRVLKSDSGNRCDCMIVWQKYRSGNIEEISEDEKDRLTQVVKGIVSQ